MAPTICSEKKTQQRCSGINDIRKQSTITSLSTSPSSNLIYAQKRSKLIRPYPARGKRPTDNSIYHISSSSDTSNDTSECYRPNSFVHSTAPSISDNSISTSTESSILSAFSSVLMSDDDFTTTCGNNLKSFSNNDDLSSIYTISSSDEEKNLDDDTIARSFHVINSDSSSSQDKVTSSTIDDDKQQQQHQRTRSITKFQMQQESKHTKGLFEIAIKMIKLVHRNQLLQRRLSQLQAETSQFIESVLANPENQVFRDKVQVNEKSRE